MIYVSPFQSSVTTVSYHKVGKGDNLFHNSENGRFVYNYLIYPLYSIKQCNLPLSLKNRLPHIYKIMPVCTLAVKTQ